MFGRYPNPNVSTITCLVGIQTKMLVQLHVWSVSQPKCMFGLYPNPNVITSTCLVGIPTQMLVQLHALVNFLVWLIPQPKY